MTLGKKQLPAHKTRSGPAICSDKLPEKMRRRQPVDYLRLFYDLIADSPVMPPTCRHVFMVRACIGPQAILPLDVPSSDNSVRGLEKFHQVASAHAQRFHARSPLSTYQRAQKASRIQIPWVMICTEKYL